jgi:hypothetical protein
MESDNMIPTISALIREAVLTRPNPEFTINEIYEEVKAIKPDINHSTLRTVISKMPSEGILLQFKKSGKAMVYVRKEAYNKLLRNDEEEDDTVEPTIVPTAQVHTSVTSCDCATGTLDALTIGSAMIDLVNHWKSRAMDRDQEDLLDHKKTEHQILTLETENKELRTKITQLEQMNKILKAKLEAFDIRNKKTLNLQELQNVVGDLDKFDA